MVSFRGQRNLAPNKIGGGSMLAFAVTASSPMTVFVGGMVATFAATGVIGVPLSFLVLAAALAFLAVGYVAMSRRVAHAGPFYAMLTHGLGRIFGVSGGVVALVAYNAIQISLYGLFGATAAGTFGGIWWIWALLMWVVVGVLGVLHVEINALVLAVALIAEIAVIVVFDVATLTAPAGGSLSLAPLNPSNLIVDGVGGVLALGIAAFVGFESAPIYSEEARGHQAVSRATFASLAFLGIFYTVTSLALTAAVGPDSVVQAAREPDTVLPMGILGDRFGSTFGLVATMLLLVSMFAALLSFHNSIARYTYAMAREKVLPYRLTVTSPGKRGGAPVGGSLVQSTIAVTVIAVFALSGLDPFTAMFVWLSTLGALGVMTLVVTTSVAVIRYFELLRRRGEATESAWTTLVSPLLGLVFGAAILGVTVANTGSLLSTEPGSALAALPTALIVAAGIAGLIWGWVLRVRRPEVYAGIGRGRPHPLLVPDPALADITV